MTLDTGILVVNRKAFLRRIESRRRASTISPTRGASLADVFRDYRGFDGIHWPELADGTLELVNGLARLDEIDAVERWLAASASRDEAEVLVLRRGAQDRRDVPIVGGRPWHSLGFDIGEVRSEYAHYSVVLNAILCGPLEELRRFGPDLNEHLLAPDIETAKKISAVHEALSRTDADVEQLESIEPIEVFARPPVRA